MKKLICILSLSGVMGCTDLTENMYNDLNKTNFYTSAAEYDAAFMNQYTFLRSMSCWNVYYLQELTTDEACLPQKGRETDTTEASTSACTGIRGRHAKRSSKGHGSNSTKPSDSPTRFSRT